MTKTLIITDSIQRTFDGVYNKIGEKNYQEKKQNFSQKS